MRIVLRGRALTLQQVAAAAAGGARVEIAPAARERIRAARELVDRIAESDVPTYGINTGFGTLAEVSIARPDLQRLQRNLILSHSAGVGAPLPAEATRALMILRANVLAGGYSGIRESTLDLLLSLLERDVLAVIPEKGSVGASGDLAPLAHLALVLIGEGEAVYRGSRVPGREALARAGLAPAGGARPSPGGARVPGARRARARASLRWCWKRRRGSRSSTGRRRCRRSGRSRCSTPSRCCGSRRSPAR